MHSDEPADGSAWRGHRAAAFVEHAAAGGVLVFAIVLAALYLHAMATTSLWSDELYSIENFASRGPFVVVSDYRAPNNHILFNLLNAILPGSDSVAPLRARLWSFAFTLGAAAWVCAFAWRRQLWIEGALGGAAILGSRYLLELDMQARGYGLLTFASVGVLSSLAAWLDGRGRRHAVALIAFVVAGAWTIPLHVLFGGAALALLAAYVRDRRALAIGLAALAGVVVCYLPVIDELIAHTGDYDAHWGRQFASFDAVWDTYRRYLPPGQSDRAIGWLLALLVSLPAVAWLATRRSPFAAALAIVAGAIAAFLIGCRLLETPPHRTVAFVVPLSVIVVIFAAGSIVRARPTAWVVPIVSVVAALAAVREIRPQIVDFRFLPRERWMQAARLIESATPDDVPVHCNFRRHYLDAYLGDSRPVAVELDSAAFAAGRLTFLESEHLKRREERIGAADLPAGAVGVELPQLRGGYLGLWLMPVGDRIERVVVGGVAIDAAPLLDRDPSTGWRRMHPGGPGPHAESIELVIASGSACRSLVMSFGGEVPAVVSARVQVDGRWMELSSAERHVGECGDALILFLGDRDVGRIELTVRLERAGDSYSVHEAWVIPR